MYIPKALQNENCFLDVAIPSNKSLFSRFGEVVPVKELYSGEEPIPLYESKSDSIEAYKEYAEQMAKESEESSKSK